MADRWVPPTGANAYNYHCSCWQKAGHGHSNACNERLVAQLVETQAQLSQAQAEIAGLRACVEAADRLRGWYTEDGGASYAVGNYDAARAKLKET
jgi:hypothetical protein